jgi:hypothetical protein
MNNFDFRDIEQPQFDVFPASTLTVQSPQHTGNWLRAFFSHISLPPCQMTITSQYIRQQYDRTKRNNLIIPPLSVDLGPAAPQRNADDKLEFARICQPES